ncbi:hypothetical protein TNCV_1211111 [Trichonephila clavipes]|nr:hypothetical protein TNCV_1211111 [Trichonephila clavipes]
MTVMEEESTDPHYSKKRIKAWANWARASATIGASSRYRLNLNTIMICIISTVKCSALLYPPKNWEMRTICQLATWDDHRPCISLGLPPCTIITHSVKRWRLVEPVCAIVSQAHLSVSVYCLYMYLTMYVLYCLLLRIKGGAYFCVGAQRLKKS